MNEVYYSTGQAARELGVTQAKVRVLCETKAIHSTCTTGGQWRIPRVEVQRLKDEGLPPVPRPLPDHAPIGRTSTRAMALLAGPSDEIIDSAEEVVRLENKVKALALNRQQEEALDWFRDREARKAATDAEQDQKESERLNQRVTVERRRVWENAWTAYALRSIPTPAPQSYRLSVYEATARVLQRLDPTQPALIIRQMVDAAVGDALSSWQKIRIVADTIKRAGNELNIPSRMKYDSSWRGRMSEAAAAAIARLRQGATEEELEFAANQAIAPLVRQFEHAELLNEMVEDVWRVLPRFDVSDLDEARATVRRALEKLVVGSPQRDFEQTRLLAITPIVKKLALREDQNMRAAILNHLSFRFINWPTEFGKQAEAEIRQAFNRLPEGTPQAELEVIREKIVDNYRERYQRNIKKDQLIELGLREIRPYIEHLERNWEFDKNAYSLTRELEDPVRASLERALGGNESADHVIAIVRRCVRQELELV